MGVEKISVETFIAHAKTFPVIDVRSEAEFEHAHIPGAWNLPLFNNDERKIVGTIYKQTSREEAIKKEYAIYRIPIKMDEWISAKLVEYVTKNKKPISADRTPINKRM